MKPNRLARFRNIHRGKRAVIVCNGPSLNQMDLGFLRGETVFGLNKIHLGLDRFGFTPRYLVAVNGFVTQIGLRPDFPLPRTDLAYGDGTRHAKSCEVIQDRDADLDLRNLSIKVARRETLTEEFHTMHLCFDAAAAVVSGQVSPQSAPQVF